MGMTCRKYCSTVASCALSPEYSRSSEISSVVGTASARMFSWSTFKVSSSIPSNAALICLKGMRMPASWMEMFSDRFGSIREITLGLPSDGAVADFFFDASSSAKRVSRSFRFTPVSPAPACSHTVPRNACACSLSQ